MRARIPRLLLVLLIAAAAVCVHAPAASAAYTSVPWPGCEGSFNSGSFDTVGRTYVVCGTPSTIGIYAASGALERSIDLTAHASDVEAVGDGSLLYVAFMNGPPLRYARQADGSYAQDASWAPAPYVMWGSTRFTPRGLFLDSDAAGNIYLADGYWASQTHTVVKYDPSGRVVTRFGEYRNTRERGWFYHALGDVAVSADGATVLSIEAGNNRLQVWRRQASGDYASIAEFGGNQVNNADRSGNCDFVGWQGAFAAPYGIGVDAAGAVYVLNTTCGQVLRFVMREDNPGPQPRFTFTLIDNLDVRVPGQDVRPHGFAVAADGRILVGQNARMLLPAGAQEFAVPPSATAADGPPTQAPASERMPSPSSTPMPSSVPTPSPPSMPTLPVIAPLAAATTSLRVTFGVRQPFIARTGSGRQLLGRIACTSRCAVSVSVYAGRRLIASRALSSWAGGRRNIALPLARTARTRSIQVRVTAHGVNATSAMTRRFRLTL